MQDKDREKTNAEKKSSFTLYDEISKIDKIVDRIILRNKEKLDKICLGEINVEKFSLKNKKGDTLYYVRKKSNKKTEDDTDSKISSGKIISESGENLGEEPIKVEEKTEDSDEIPEEKSSKKRKKRIRFNKKDEKVVDKYSVPPATTEDLIESEDFDEVISGFGDILKNEASKQTDEDAKIIDEKIVETPGIDDSSQEKDAAEAKAAELAEEHEFFSKEKTKKKTDDFTKTKIELEKTKKEIEEKKRALEEAIEKEKEKEKELKRKKIEKIKQEKLERIELKKKIREQKLKEKERKKAEWQREKELEKLEMKKLEEEKLKVKETERAEKQKEKELKKLEKKKLEEEKLKLKETEKAEKQKEKELEKLEKEKLEEKKQKEKLKEKKELEDFDEVISGFGDILKNEASKQTDEDAKIIDEKIVETPGIDDSSQEKDAAEAKAAELAEEHEFFSKEKTGKTKDKKDKDWLSSSTDDLADLKKKYSGKLIVSDLDLAEADELSKDESELLDEKIKEAPITEDSDKKEIKVSGEDIGASKVKKSFFKRKRPSRDKAVDLEQEEIEPDKLAKKPGSHVKDLPQDVEFDEDEIRLVDEEIKEFQGFVDSEAETEKGESEALKLAKEHLKDRQMPAPEKKAKTDIEIPTGVPLTEGDADHEHVFFDEEELSFKGWSPQMTEKGKKRMIELPSAQDEIGSDDLKSVEDIELPKEVLQTNSVKLTDLGFSEKEWEKLDFYSLQEPFAYVEILREKESLDKCYFLVEIALTEEEEKLLSFIKDTMASLDIDTFELEEKSEEEYLLDRLDQVIDEYNVEINEESRNRIFYYISKTSLGLDRIDALMKDPNIEDISCDGSDVPVFLYHRKYGSLKSNVRFNDEDELSSFVHKLAQKCGKHISIAEPMLDATMPDGSRIQMTLSDEITAKGSTFTIRKFRADPFSPPDLIEFNTMSSEIIAYMWIAVENGINTLFAGGTASGKTTALNALSLFIPRESKIVSIEETREINLPHPNWIPGVARSGFGEVIADKVVGEINMYDLMKAALRQRPEYILVGEIRGREAYVLFQAMATGHATYSTAHADSAQSLIHRLEGKPINIPRIMLQSLDIVCLHVITRVKNIRARRCKQVIEVIDIDPTTKEILTNEVFRWDPVEDKFIYSGKSYVLERVRAEKDLTREEMTDELKNRKKIVEWMNENNIREFREVSNVVARYSEDSSEMLKQIEKGAKK